jgi:hypothetical protein
MTEYSMTEIMNSLIHSFMYSNVSKYSWRLLNMIIKEEDKLYICIASKVTDKIADCTIHIYPTPDKVSTAAYNFVLTIRDEDGYAIGTTVGLFDSVINHAHVLDCLLTANNFNGVVNNE